MADKRTRGDVTTALDFTRPDRVFEPDEWAGASATDAARHVRDESERCLGAYRAKPSLVREHASIERATAQGGYGHRQLYELVQNGADALVDTAGGRIEVVLTDDALYCANEGDPIDRWGVEAILSSHVSMKRGTEIGRFGLGFKSVLGVSNVPQFFSRSACFGFDAQSAALRIRKVVPDAERTPVLRIATLLDPVEAAAHDPVLRDLMGWAATVVRLPRDVGDSSWLKTDIARFPAEFLLFSPHVGALVLDDRTTAAVRVLTVETRHSTYRLRDGADESEWKVFSTVHRPSGAAREDAGELSDRTELPLIWAVPTRSRRRRGAFWAFFPTTYETTLSGILNAPWKTNEDRQNLLEGSFNEELLDAAANLVVRRLADLVDADEPGHLLDYLPGRGDEAQQWADRRLSAQVYALAETHPCLPDQEGRLRLPSELSLHPPQATEDALRLWSAYQGRPTSWCHPSIATRDRRARAERLLGNRQWAVANLRMWLEALAEDGSVPASAAAIRVADSLVAELAPAVRDEMRPARIVLAEGGSLVAASSPSVFLRGEWDVTADMQFVHPELASDPEMVQALTRLGVGRVDPEKEFEALVTRGLFARVDWGAFWSLARHVPTDTARRVIAKRPRNAAPIHVRTLSNVFSPIDEVLLPGKVVPSDGSRDAALTVDIQFHGADLDLLGSLGVAEGPTPKGGSRSETWFVEYRRQMDSLYEGALRGRRGRPQSGYIQFDRAALPGPLAPLMRLSEEGRERFTSIVLNYQECFAPWTMAHQTRRDSYPVIEVESPVKWLVRREGRVMSSVGRVRAGAAVGRALDAYAFALPVVVFSHALTRALGLPQSVDELEQHHWDAAFRTLLEADTAPDERLGAFYAAAVRAGADPGPELLCRVGDHHEPIDPHTVNVVSEREEFEALAGIGVPCLLASSADATTLVEKLGCAASTGVITTEVDAIPVAPDVLLGDEFPVLREFAAAADLLLVRCSVVRVVTVTPHGTRTAVVNYVCRDGRFYWTDDRGDVALLGAVIETMGLDLPESRVRTVIEEQRDQLRRQRAQLIAGLADEPSKLVAAVGIDALSRHLPTDLIESVRGVRGGLADTGIAELFLATHGIDSLRKLTPELEAAGLQPPRTWAGSGPALAFVRDLGFPREFAGFEERRRSPFLEVDGPVSLDPLHPFQRAVSDRLRAVLTAPEEKRGLLSLPTGAGKTRVAVESLVTAYADNEIRTPVLWVAQTDELCEQAVQTWAYVWRAVGPRESLHISRLWASHDAEPVDMPHVVIATIAKLNHCVGKERYEWLAKPSAVVIDEAHGSTTSSYTALLNWLGLGRGRQARPLIGLTATPFRGRSESGADELAARYGRRRLDAGAFAGDPYPILQDMGVLARVRHHLLGGSVIELAESELTLLKQTGRLPSSAEERLGVNADRNAALVDSIASVPSDWTVLVFATSVTNAQTLAATLSLDGVPARAISAKTEASARKHYISEFRAGRLRVLTNYGVLTEGFDAPAVRAVYVARPTFSPNLYQQMVGRGLRGPLNGGKEECLIVDVADNIVEYGGELAFRGFEYLWTGG